jgi:uncharacterized protein YcfL
MYSLKHFLLFLMLLLIAGGCATTTTSNVLSVDVASGIAGNRSVEENNHQLASSLEFGDIGVRKLSADMFEVQVMIKNQRKKDVSFEYRFIWYDAKGFELTSAPAWTPAKLSGKEARGFRTITPVSGAVKFKLMVRKPNPVNQ